MARIIEIDDYSFMSQEILGAMVDTNAPRRRGKICLSGIYVDYVSALLGTHDNIQVAVKEIKDDGTIVTPNYICQLGTINPDYEEYLRATRSGIQSVVNWNIYGSKERGYYLTADMYPQLKATGPSKIVSQEGNFLVIQRQKRIPSGELIWADEQKVFVCWSSISAQAQREIETRGKVADISYAKCFGIFNGNKCKPRFLA